MPWRPHGKATVNARSPEAFGVCDRCGTMYNRNRLRYQTVRSGNTLTQTKLAVCRTCLDVPRPPMNPRISPDGQPIQNARPEPQRAPLPNGGT